MLRHHRLGEGRRQPSAQGGPVLGAGAPAWVLRGQRSVLDRHSDTQLPRPPSSLSSGRGERVPKECSRRIRSTRPAEADRAERPAHAEAPTPTCRTDPTQAHAGPHTHTTPTPNPVLQELPTTWSCSLQGSRHPPGVGQESSAPGAAQFPGGDRGAAKRPGQPGARLGGDSQSATATLRLTLGLGGRLSELAREAHCWPWGLLGMDPGPPASAPPPAHPQPEAVYSLFLPQ